MKARGFSLIELLCTLTIILILFVLVVGRGGPTPEKRALAGCQVNLQKIYLALSVYAMDNKGSYPYLNASSSEPPLSLLVPRSTAMTAIFICPGSKDAPLPEGVPFGAARISYAYYMGRATNAGGGDTLITDSQVDTLAKLEGAPLFSTSGHQPGGNHGKMGGNLLQADGQILFSPAKAIRDLPVTNGVSLLNP